jgi:serine/threonine protein kinase
VFQSSSSEPAAEPSSTEERSSPGSQVLASGARVSRYVIDGLIGVGAAGVVYGAHDPQLRRKIALKLMRPDRSPSSHGDALQPRLLREARAMAQLSHPNVVTVFDVGTYEDQIFIVMELVLGETLARWLAGEKRSWQEIVRAFTEAGQGLAAAHAVQIVHRDFKPANVLVGSDGRVRVTDFGLAHPMIAVPERETGEESAVPAARQDGGALATWTATEGGGLAGTPIFMAPEQFLRGRPDARTDQFSFCVALYMALYGRHPFAEGPPEQRTLATLSRDVIAGNLQPLPGASEVPRPIFDALSRGLMVDPEHRFASMEDLLHALKIDRGERMPAHRPRRAWVPALVAGVVAIAWALTAWRAGRRTQPAIASAVVAAAPAPAPPREPDPPVETPAKTDVAPKTARPTPRVERKVRVPAPKAERKRYDDALKDPFQ